MGFVPHRLAYFTYHNALQFHPCCRKGYKLLLSLCCIEFHYLFLKRGEGRERGRNIKVWLPFTYSLLGTWPATQACALTGN